MESDGSLTPSRSQSSFARNYNDGIGQGSASDGLAILGETEAASESDALRFAALAQPAPLPRADVLLGIEATALRYAGHPGLRRAELSVRDWLALYRANIEVESAYRQDAISSAGAIGLGQLMPATARDLGVDPRDPLQNLDGSARYLAIMLETLRRCASGAGGLQRGARCGPPVWRRSPLPRNPEPRGPRHGRCGPIGRIKFMKQISNLFVASLALFLLIAEPALAQSIDLSPIQSLLQGIVDALTGPLGVVIATLAVLGVFLSWFFNIIDLRQALWVLVGIAGVAAAPTIVAAVFAGG